MRIKGLILVIISAVLLVVTMTLTNAHASQDKGINAECQVNNSNKDCNPGLVCVPFNQQSGNGKCELAPTNTPTPKPTATPTPKPTATPTPKPTATPTPTAHHYGCNEDHECVWLPGYGDNSCNPEWEGSCHKVTPTPTPTITPTPTPGCGDDEDCITPTVTPTPTVSTPVTGCTENCGASNQATQAPQCPNGTVNDLPTNPFVVRSGTDATVNFFIPTWETANVYWSVVGQPHWGNSSASQAPNGLTPNSEGFVSYTIHNLDASQGYDFGIQPKIGCGGGKITEVVVDGPQSRVFTFSYLELSK